MKTFGLVRRVSTRVFRVLNDEGNMFSVCILITPTQKEKYIPVDLFHTTL